MKLFRNPWFKLIAILLFFGLAYFILRAYNIDYPKLKNIDPQLIRAKIKTLGLWAPVVYVICYALRPLILFPAGVFTILGGIIFGCFWGTVYVILGAMLSAVVEFFLARHFGREVIVQLFKGKTAHVDKAVERHGFKTVLLIRLIPNVAYDIQNFSLGLTRVKFKDYCFATFLGIIPASFLFVYLGYSLVDFRHAWKIIPIALIFVGVYFFQRHVRKNIFIK